MLKGSTIMGRGEKAAYIPQRRSALKGEGPPSAMVEIGKKNKKSHSSTARKGGQSSCTKGQEEGALVCRENGELCI